MFSGQHVQMRESTRQAMCKLLLGVQLLGKLTSQDLNEDDPCSAITRWVYKLGELRQLILTAFYPNVGFRPNDEVLCCANVSRLSIFVFALGSS
jgi:hypothetical protein